MKYGNEIRTWALRNDPRFAHLPEGDRYLSAAEPPALRFNLIGAGIMGQEHLRVTYLEGRAAVHGVYDPNPRSVEAARHIHNLLSPDPLHVYDSLEGACSDPAADALIIATPNYTHLDVVKVAVESGKPILLEKPISTTLADACAITQIAAHYPAPFQLGLQYRYKSIYREAIHEAKARQAVGAIHMVSMAEHRIPFLDKVNQWNKFTRFSGDTLIEKCCHYFDLLNLFAGSRPVSAFASGGQAVNFTQFEYNGERADVLDHALVVVNYENGVRAQFSLCMFAPMFYEELCVLGDGGRLRAWERQTFATGFETESGLEIDRGEVGASRQAEPHYPTWIEKSGHSGATYYEHARFVDRLLGISPPPGDIAPATADEGLWSIIVAAAAQESIRTGQVIHINDLLAREGITATR